MTLQSDHKALLFVGAIAVLGAGVRVVRAASASGAPQSQPALERQMQSTDSAKRAAAGGKRQGRKKTPPRARAGEVGSGSGSSPASNQRAHVDGKLDIDVATAAQIDSLPGISPALAKKIVADRMRRGPFLRRETLRRVPGVSAKTLAKLDSMVVFSGTIVPVNAEDTVIARTKRSRKSRSP